jgi:hypothetical protein
VKSGYFPNFRGRSQGKDAGATQAFRQCNAARWTMDAIMLNGGLGCWHGELPELDGQLDCHGVVTKVLVVEHIGVSMLRRNAAAPGGY